MLTVSRNEKRSLPSRAKPSDAQANAIYALRVEDAATRVAPLSLVEEGRVSARYFSV